MILSARKWLLFASTLFLIYFLSSCSNEKFFFINRVKVKNYPDTPFVYSNQVNVTGDISKDEKTRLQENLDNYWADSLYAHRIQKLGILYTLKNPPVFDTSNLAVSRGFMNGFLFSQGYFSTSLKDSFYIDTFHKGTHPAQYRTNVVMTVNPGKRSVIDSLVYDLKDSSLQRIAVKTGAEGSITKGKTPYSKEVISAELDRLVTTYRQRGYFLLKKDNLIAVIDTTNTALLKLTLDPFEQEELIEQAASKKNNNPSVSVSIQQRRLADTTLHLTDSSFLKKFHAGSINYFPETRITQFPDSILLHTGDYKQWRAKNYSVFYDHGTFNPSLFKHFNYLRPGKMYDDALFYKVVNMFGQIGAWSQVDTRTVIKGDSIDLNYFLYPARKQNITYNLEASRNTGDILSSNNFFGLALNITYINRNVWRQAVQSATSFTNGVELSLDRSEYNSILQAFQFSLGQTYSLPRPFIPFKVKRPNRLDYGRTIISANASYSDRADFFRIRSFVADYGYNWKIKNKIWQFRFPNVELYSLDTLPQLAEAFVNNPFLRNSFNTGYVISAQGSLIITYKGNSSNISNYAGFTVEESGLPGFKSSDSKIYQYIKVTAESRKAIVINKSTIAFRALAGIGYNYNNTGRFGATLPFFKQFIAGGPNSMRAWALRQLGLGSSLLSDTASTFRDRYGDMQLEANAEYRYPIAHFSSVNINGALFADAGNIWNVRKDPDNPNSEFNINRLGKDIALGVGTGLRLDFNYFLLRVDFGIKMKDPARLANNGWLDVSKFTWRDYEFEKFNSSGERISPIRNNYAVQLGIGLPF